MSKEKKEFTFIDLFAGIGGFHIAMHEAGGKCVFASEIDKFARMTYEHNFRKISPELFKNGNFNEDITKMDYSKIPDFDVLCAGFPCQPFSHAGLKNGFDDTRGTLFFNIKEIIRTKCEYHLKQGNTSKIPSIIILENVKGFKNHDKGKTYRVVCETLDELGYEVKSDILNSKNFGLPQNRERIFIVAWYRDKFALSSEDFNLPVGLTEDNQPIFSKSMVNLLSQKTFVGDILLSENELRIKENKYNKTYTLSERLWLGHQRRKQEHMRKGNGFGYSLFNSKSHYTSTISARYYKDGSEILIDQSNIENERPRKLHPIEAARLQGFPIDDWFDIPVSDNQAYKQFGNSVSIPVVRTLASTILKQFIK